MIAWENQVVRYWDEQSYIRHDEEMDRRARRRDARRAAEEREFDAYYARPALCTCGHIQGVHDVPPGTPCMASLCQCQRFEKAEEDELEARRRWM